MSLVIRAIEAAGPDTYRLVLTEHGLAREVRCTVIDGGGVRAVQPEPDVFMTGELPARVVSVAILAFHDAVLSAASRQPG